MLAAERIARPIALEAPSPPGMTTSASPARPTSTESRVASATRSRASVRRRITCSGTEPAIIAAMLESIRVSASVTMPTPSASSESPSSAEDASSRRVTRMLRPRHRQDQREQGAGEQEARAGGEERRQRLDRELDREVGRAPDQVDGPERGQELPAGGGGHVYERNDRREIPQRWVTGRRSRGSSRFLSSG